MSASPSPVAPPLASARGRAGAIWPALRPRQWTKNLLLFGALVFAAELDEPSRWLQASTGFLAFCAVSSAAYLLNDVRDAPSDRLHPKKRRRPVASGALASSTALAASAALAAGGFALGVVLGGRFELVLAGFALLQIAYTFGLKRMALVDVAAIAGCFVLRAAAGAAAVHVHASGWLLLCTALLALFLGFSKRRAELGARGPGENGRAVLEAYSVPWLDALVVGSAAAVAVVYGAYCVLAHGSLAFLGTLPFVILGLSRYLFLVYRHDLGEEPENLLFADPIILACVAAWAVTAGSVLFAS
jgi:decaprenyl-phosphate phosphoribosyltransferase